MEVPKSGFLPALFSALLAPIIRSLDKPSLPKYGGDLALAGLQDGVKVHWEAHAVPHVFAANERDLFFAQGYLHAQERLWQMDLTRRFLTGRLAEIFGNFPIPWRELAASFRGRQSADFDYFMRLIGIREAAVASLEILSETERVCLEAYSDGVNRYIERCGKRLPWEFRLLRYHAEPWRSEDCLTVGKGFAFLVSPALFARLNMIAVAARLGDQREKLRDLFPTYPEDGPTIVRAVQDSARGIWRFMNGAMAQGEWHPSGNGSNGWVIAPQRSTTGGAMLSNDTHLRMTAPPIWYLMHLRARPGPAETDGYEAWGASVPGLPCIQIGVNRSIAWGITASVCDDVDLYREKIHRLDPNAYLCGHEWLSMTRREEVIRVKGGGPVNRTVRATRHGPVLSDFDAGSGAGDVLALRWTAHEPGQDFRCLYGINRAQDWSQFLESLSFQSAPALNYLYADRQGNIGYSLAGKIPDRPRAPSLLPLAGWDGHNEWRGFLPFDQLPRIYNPPDGVIATANNKIVDASYPNYLSSFFEPPYRSRRIQELLAAKPTHSPDDLARMQLDAVSLHAEELIQILAADLGRIPQHERRLREAVVELLAWDGYCGPSSVAAAIFHVFHHRLMANLLVPALGEELFAAYVEVLNECVTPVDQILRNPDSPWFARRPRAVLVVQSLREALDELSVGLGDEMEQWHWGRIHTLSLNHPLGRAAFLHPTVSLGPFPSPGDGMTVNLGFYRHSDPYRHSVGATLRMVCDLAPSGDSGFTLASGQSGHRFSAHFCDQTEHWRNGRLAPMSGADIEQKASSCLVLVPPAVKRNPAGSSP